jgi:hypothetical protein
VPTAGAGGFCDKAGVAATTTPDSTRHATLALIEPPLSPAFLNIKPEASEPLACPNRQGEANAITDEVEVGVFSARR